jgi:hypothetical protein
LVNPDCPTGYHCDTQQCVRDGLVVPLFLSDRVEDSLGGFAVRSHGNDAVVCWRDSLEARTIRLSAAVVQSNGSLTRSPFPLYEDTTGSLSSLRGWAGGCSVIGDNIVSVIIRFGLNGAFVQRFFVSDLDGQDLRAFADDQSFISSLSNGVPGLTQIQVQPGLGGAIMTYPRDASGSDNRPKFWLTTIDPSLMVSSRQLPMPLASLSDYLETVTGFAANSGIWFAGQRFDGTYVIGWTPSDDSPGHFVTGLLPAGVPTSILGQRGDDLAMAYRTSVEGESARWQVAWVRHDATGEHAVLGPELTLDEAVLQPGGVVDGGNLIIAGATGIDRVMTWSVPWGSAEPPAVRGSIRKTSRVIPNRFAIATANGNTFVEWSERTAMTASGTSYSALYVGVVSQ